MKISYTTHSLLKTQNSYNIIYKWLQEKQKENRIRKQYKREPKIDNGEW